MKIPQRFTFMFKDTTRALSWLRCRPAGDPKIEQELDLIRAEQNKDESNNFLLKDICKLNHLFNQFIYSFVFRYMHL